ncbi:MAG: histidine triad nucleotide-binding protein [Puniceicoccaceae bacterium MED-G31]|mgnify:FL=1|nr:histidine triad nucleotide-binding protein [Coraliomargarita sp.]PDH29461.1 MAG: histidine triad nucleotide-binding protein [Puniceicoccaceae bacterium MED-G31]HBO58105.1 histidine triad nucleotide-binding protein [Opitutae bacterium]|tara:strand:+ start:25053 stop:25391 length:339 start_codon:yes stop_codon:yes gene_type:complete
MTTLFEKIISGEVPAKILFEDAHCFAINDINPQAPTHLLVVPKKALPRIGAAEESDQELLGHLLLTAASIADSMNLHKGYRIVINNGPDGGECVPHLHVHVLAGRAMQWPPG